MEMFGDEYLDLYRIDAEDDWRNSAYDENGNSVYCGSCGAELRWRPEECTYGCPECGSQMSRAEFFDEIDARPSGSLCLTNCRENYPFCKKYCVVYPIDPDDPMLM